MKTNEKTNSTITMKESKISLGAGIGLLAGIIIGSATDNIGLWIALGLCFGAGIGTTLEKKLNENYTSFKKRGKKTNFRKI